MFWESKTIAEPASAPAAAAAVKPEAKTAAAANPAKEQPVTYKVRQIVRLDQIKAGTKNVRMWVAIPDDEQNQRVLDLNVVAAPGKWSIVPDLENRARFVKVEVKEPKGEAIDVEVDFVVTRNPVYVAVEAKRVGQLSESLKKAFAPHLALKTPHMEVNEKILEIAKEVCGDETNLATQASLLMEHVAKLADHYSYSKDPLMPKCGIGDAIACLKQGGGCCTDLHSLFIALARARGIPARLAMGYRLQEKNLDKLVDPGYRCWVEYFLPNYGWVSADIVEADAPGGLGAVRWSRGLTARRVWLNPGREYRLAEDQAVGRVNHMSIAYAEIDGVPARVLPEGELQPQISRKVQFTEITTPSSGLATAAGR
jgi:transglutaminase-like putative cysteine protease